MAAIVVMADPEATKVTYRPDSLTYVKELD
jgi:hypothetical protein